MVYRILGSMAMLVLSTFVLFAQEDDEEYYEQLLTKEVEVENPVYKPVLSIGTGIIHNFSDIRYPSSNPLQGNLGYKLNVSTFVGKENYYRLNFFLLYGTVQGHDYNISRAMQSNTLLLPLDDNLLPIYHNSAFRTEFFELGISLEYGFGHWLGKSKRFKPFVSLGVSPFPFTPKGNIVNGPMDGSNGYYYFWDDGNMRDLHHLDPNASNASIINFDKEWETDLNKADFHGLGKFSQTNVAFPFEVGFDFYLSYRVNLRVSSALHYTLTDLLDNYNADVASRYGLQSKGYHDMFLFTNVAFSFDLFSDPEMIKVDMLFAEIDVDYDVMFADQDMDGVFDRLDECPDTPIGIEVDSVGCPFDMDGDGVPDFMDNEPNTPSGVVVDDKGVQLTPDQLAQIFERPTAVRREEVRVLPPAPIWTRSIAFTPGVIPAKFKRFDADFDGYISFGELLKAIEQFFDGTLNFTTEDIYELNSFFFSQ